MAMPMPMLTHIISSLMPWYDRPGTNEGLMAGVPWMGGVLGEGFESGAEDVVCFLSLLGRFRLESCVYCLLISSL